MKHALRFVLFVAASLAACLPVSATLALRISDGTPAGTLVIVDQSPDDFNNVVGAVSYTGPVGTNWLATVSTVALSATAFFPNPAHGHATVQLPVIPGTATATLTLLDALGRTLRTQTATTNSRTELDLTGLAPGLYALRVMAGTQTATHHLVVE